MNLKCIQIAPHPKNRGGEAIRSKRTKKLTGDIVESGYDISDATHVSVVVEIDIGANNQPSTRFSDHWNQSSGLDPDHAAYPEQIMYGGLSTTR